MVQENSIWAWQMVCLHQGSTITVLSSTALVDTHTHHNTEPPTRSVTPKGFTMAGNHSPPCKQQQTNYSTSTNKTDTKAKEGPN